MFKPGDKVGFLHESGYGTIVKMIDDHTAEVEVDGIEIPYAISELIDLDELKVHTVEDEALEMLQEKKGINRAGKKSQGNQPSAEIDLHIENLVDRHSHMSNGEILQLQKRRLKDYLEKVEDHKMRKVVIIHGVGQGVLKEEIRYLLKQFEHYEFMDAPYYLYGYGATELRIYYHH